MVPCATPWGCWYQTLEEVFIEVQVPPGTRAKDVRCCLQSQRLALSVQGQDVLQVPRARDGGRPRGRRPGGRVANSPGLPSRLRERDTNLQEAAESHPGDQ